MTEEKFPERDAFNTRMGLVETIEDLTDKSDERKEKRVEVRQKAQKTLRKIAYEYGVAIGQVDPALVPNPEALPDENVQRYIAMQEDWASTEATALMGGSLEKILAGTDSGKLANLALVKEFREAAGDGWQRIADLYASNAAYKGLVGKAKKKDLTEKEEDMLTERALAIYQAEQVKVYSKGQFKGNDFLAKLAASAATALLKVGKSRESIDKYLVKAAESLVKESETEIKNHEAERGQNIKGYTIAAISKLMKGSTDQATIARGQLYAVTKGKK